jgi:hypothetical protein
MAEDRKKHRDDKQEGMHSFWRKDCVSLVMLYLEHAEKDTWSVSCDVSANSYNYQIIYKIF